MTGAGRWEVRAAGAGSHPPDGNRDVQDGEGAPERAETADGPGEVSLLGLRFVRLSQSSIVDEIERRIDLGGSPQWIVTANVQQVGLAGRDESYRELLSGADLITADGMPICWVARLIGDELPGRVTGADLVDPLAERCAARGWSLFLLGGEEGVADQVGQTLCARHPGLRIAGTHSPPYLPVEEFLESGASREAVRQIREAQPHVLLVALGSPKQDHWIARHREVLGVPVSIGVGGSFDFVIGRQVRAPRWMQSIGLEWLHRAFRDPFRMVPRYLREGATFARLTLRELAAGRR